MLLHKEIDTHILNSMCMYTQLIALIDYSNDTDVSPSRSFSNKMMHKSSIGNRSTVQSLLISLSLYDNYNNSSSHICLNKYQWKEINQCWRPKIKKKTHASKNR